MPLEDYRRSRMIILRPRSTAYEAARAMADNHVGAVLVHDDHHIVGLVTDRDVALEVVAGDLDAHSTPLHDIMSDEVATLEISASIDDVVRTMRDRACRRVPLTEHGRPVGLVTLDDLLADGVIDAGTAGSIVKAQLEVAARFKPEGALHPEEPARPELSRGRMRALTRRKARADSAYGRLLHAVERHSGLQTREHAELALEIALGSLCRRVTPQEARHLIAQLPSRLHPSLAPFLDGPDKRITTDTIEGDLARELRMDREAAGFVLQAICEAIADSVSAGEVEGFRGQLPLDMKDLFPPTPLRRAG
ncbi:hypothetical protein SOCE26_094850 [Sorangium cellulosum]|uniref:CBS domain-containing protein n=1 Tax=Sorangium cellulosum TaxID=56 RepID=A0A2L0F930_SORCE|nr:hypothetical protein SOCE26_094850 [Sorangium cellulosum]